MNANLGNLTACHVSLTYVNIKFLNGIGNLTTCHVYLTKENVRFLYGKFLSVGNLTSCHVSLTKEILCKCQISEYIHAGNLTHVKFFGR